MVLEHDVPLADHWQARYEAGATSMVGGATEGETSMRERETG
jgi:hypothetical protein